jgi:hypothetical protein
LEKNGARGAEIEKLPRHEFVIDVALRDKMKEANLQQVQKVLEVYRLRKFWDELNAARLRELCWDSMAYHSRSILPFMHDSK